MTNLTVNLIIVGLIILILGTLLVVRLRRRLTKNTSKEIDTRNPSMSKVTVKRDEERDEVKTGYTSMNESNPYYGEGNQNDYANRPSWRDIERKKQSDE